MCHPSTPILTSVRLTINRTDRTVIIYLLPTAILLYLHAYVTVTISQSAQSCNACVAHFVTITTVTSRICGVFVFGLVHFCPQATRHSRNGYWSVRERLQMIFRIVSYRICDHHNSDVTPNKRSPSPQSRHAYVTHIQQSSTSSVKLSICLRDHGHVIHM